MRTARNDMEYNTGQQRKMDKEQEMARANRYETGSGILVDA
jgi:hypothetical protein